MSTFKKGKVVMLPTNEKSLNSVFSLRSDKPYLMSEQNSPFKARIYDTKDLYHTYFHLYIISDDEIKLFDWVYNNKENIVEQITSKTQLIFVLEENKENQTFKKIIATTDESLYFKDTNKNPKQYMGSYMSMSLGERLPQPSQQFIQKFVEEYNKGNIITDVLVEYNCGDSHCSLFGCQKHLGCKNESIQTVKINPKDNTITIKKVKDSWSREELTDILQVYRLDYEQYKRSCHYGPNQKEIVDWSNKWIKENL